jgi:LysR family transcriptional regulator for bpeEF and oprC
MSLDSFHLMGVFVRVAEARSFTVAAERLGISPSAASKAVARLEDKLGVRLVQRTTRSVRPTEEGEILLTSCRNVLAELEDTEARLSTRVEEPSGRLRLHATLGFGRYVVAPLISEFTTRWPRLTVDMDLSEREPNLDQEAFDMSVRFGELPDSALVGRPLGRMQFAAIASPAYLAAHGEPRTPADLASHACLGYFLPRVLRYRDWEFIDGQTRIAPSGRLNFNNTQPLLEAAIDGHGIAHMPRIVAHRALAAGQVRAVLEDFATPGWPVSLVYLERRYQSRRVKALVDFLVERVPADGRWQPVRAAG